MRSEEIEREVGEARQFEELAAALRLHGTKTEWAGWGELVHDAAVTLRMQQRILDELREILGCREHELVTDRAREVMALVRPLLRAWGYADATS